MHSYDILDLSKFQSWAHILAIDTCKNSWAHYSLTSVKDVHCASLQRASKEARFRTSPPALQLANRYTECIVQGKRFGMKC